MGTHAGNRHPQRAITGLAVGTITDLLDWWGTRFFIKVSLDCILSLVGAQREEKHCRCCHDWGYRQKPKFCSHGNTIEKPETGLTFFDFVVLFASHPPHIAITGHFGQLSLFYQSMGMYAQDVCGGLFSNSSRNRPPWFFMHLEVLFCL